MSKFLLGGRLGDLVHALYVPKNTAGRHDLYITDRRDLHSDGFLLSLSDTFNELMPIIVQQDWFSSWNIYGSHESPPFEVTESTNLSMWRRYAYSASWTQLLSNTFNVPLNGEPWIKLNKIAGWSDKIVIHASTNQARRGHHWNVVMNMFEGQCVFVGNRDEYRLLGFDIPFHEPKDLLEHFQIINSCKFFIGNQSAPLAMAHSLGVPRLAMLNEIDKLHYTGEERFHKEYYWIAKDTHFFPGLNLE